MTMITFNLDTMLAVAEHAFKVPRKPEALERYLDQVEKLAEFCLANGINLVPPVDELVLVNRGKDATVPRKLLAAWLTAIPDLELISAKDTREGLVGCRRRLSYDNPEGGPALKYQCFEYDPDADKGVTRVYIDQFGAWWLKLVSKELDKLTPSQTVSLFHILLPQVEVSERAVMIARDNGGISIDFVSGEVNTRSGLRTAMSRAAVGGESVSSRGVLFAVGTYLTKYVGSELAYLQGLPNLWEREANYGLMDVDDPTKVISDHSLMPIGTVQGFAMASTWPWVVPANEKFEVELTSTVSVDAKAFMVDKYAMKFVGTETAANAALIGRCHDGGVDEILTLHDASKASKFFNRPTQARKHLKASVEGRAKSSFLVELPDGTRVGQSGVRLRTVLTNSRLGAGSGPALVRADFSLDVKVSKTLKGKINFDRIPKDIRKGIEVEDVLEKVNDLLESKIGQVFLPGQPLVSCLGKDILVNRENAPVRLTGIKRLEKLTSDGAYKATSVNVMAHVDLEVTSGYWKLRNDGVKLTTLPADVRLSGSPNWDIILNNETQKGKLTHVAAYVAANGGGVYNPNSGILTMNDGDVLDLLAEGPYCNIALRNKGSLIQEWVKANAVVDYLTVSLPLVEWELLKLYGNCDDIEVLEEFDTHVVVKERIEALYCDYFFEVEISTPHENTGTSAMTPEMLAAISLLSPELAVGIYNASAESRQSVKGLVDMVLIEPRGEVVNITSVKGRQIFQQGVGNLEGKSDREVLRQLTAAFPEGLYLYASSQKFTGEVTQYINFNVVSSMMTFIGGSAEGIAEDIISFMCYLSNPDDTRVDQHIYSTMCLLRKSLRGWLQKAMESRGLLKRAARTAKVLCNSKIRTAYLPELNHGKGELPKVLIHPEDVLCKYLAMQADGTINPKYLEDGKFNPELLDGEVVQAGRIPMPMICSVKLVVGRQGTPAHVLMLPSVWAMCNEGDSDGDGIFLLNGNHYGVASIDNTSLMSMGGYRYCYGAESSWPCAEFSSYEVKHGKEDEPSKKSLTEVEGPYVTRILTSEYLRSAKLVRGHYSYNVGIAYGICSALTFQAANAACVEGLDITVLEEALAITWRLIYEGMGLSGYSVKARSFFEILSVATWESNYGVDKDGRPVKTKDTVNGVNPCVPELLKLLGLPPESADAMNRILRANKLRMIASAAKSGAWWMKLVSLADEQAAAMLGSLRDLGRGIDSAGLAELDAMNAEIVEDEVTPKSCYTTVLKYNLHEKISCNWLSEMLLEGCHIHRKVTKKLKALRDLD